MGTFKPFLQSVIHFGCLILLIMNKRFPCHMRGATITTDILHNCRCLISLTQGKVQGWSAIGLFFMGIKHFLAYCILCKKMPLISVPCQAVKLLPVSSLCLFRTAFVSSVVKRITLDVSDVGILIHLKFFCAAHC